MSPRFTAALALACFSLNAHAVYRCHNGSAVSYSDSPCKTGRSVDISEKVQDRVSPADATESKQRLLRQQKYLGEVNAEIRKDELAAERRKKKEAQEKARLEKKCALLALRSKWAQEDVTVASMRTQAAAKRKAARAEERYLLSCKQ